MDEKEETLNQIYELLRDLVKTDFWGNVTLKFKSGKIYLLLQEKQIKFSEN